jgi:methyl-accepting chemotaxis protein
MPAPQTSAKPHQRRRVKLILPALQFRLIAYSGAIATLALGLQFLLFSRLVGQLAARLPSENVRALELGSRALLEALGLSAMLLLPLVLWIGINATFRIAGPLFRMKRYLEQVARGEKPADCQLRRGDQLQDFCAAINEATRPLRQATSEQQRAEQRTATTTSAEAA